MVYLKDIKIFTYPKYSKNVLYLANESWKLLSFDGLSPDCLIVLHLNNYDNVRSISDHILDYLSYIDKKPIPIFELGINCASMGRAFMLANSLMNTYNFSNVGIVAVHKMSEISKDYRLEIMMKSADIYEREKYPNPAYYYALFARDYERKYNVDHKYIAKIAEKMYFHASKNTVNYYRHFYSLDDILASEILYFPLHKLECVKLIDGSVSILLTKEKQPIKVVCAYSLTETGRLDNVKDKSEIEIVWKLFDLISRKYNVSYRDMDVFILDSPYSIAELLSFEALRLVPKGQGWKCYLDGITYYNGRYPVNPCGGYFGKGHASICNMGFQIYELYRQLMEKSSGYQVAIKNGIGIVSSVGNTFMDASVVILKRNA